MKAYLLALALLAPLGCASAPKQSDAQRLAMYLEHAGASVPHFSYFGSLNGWTPLGKEALAVWTRPNEAYLLQLAGPCPDLDFAPAISISETMHQVSARFDRVTPLGRGSMTIPCQIREIRQIDAKALKQAEKDLREAKTETRVDPKE